MRINRNKNNKSFKQVYNKNNKMIDDK